jgi:hypothetical protein
MNRLAIVSALSLALSTPAAARLQIAADFGGVIFTCVDNAACDSNPATGVMQLMNLNLGGVEVNGSIQASGRGPNFLNTSSLSVINGAGHAVAYDVTVGDTSFAPIVTSTAFSGAGVWQNAIGSTANLSWWADPANAQGASFAGLTPGFEQGAFSSTASRTVDAFSDHGANPFFAPTPFSMTEDVTGVILKGGQLINRGQAMEAVPEPSTWAMLALGFGGLAFLGMRKARRQSLTF